MAQQCLTNLAGGSTTTIPVTVTYNDSTNGRSTRVHFHKSDKRELIIQLKII